MIVAPVAGTFGFDAFAYWSVNLADPYGAPVGGLAAFNYSPPIASLFATFSTLPWLSFLWLWVAAMIGTIVWLGGRGHRAIWLLAFPPIALDLYHGNVHLLIAAAIVLGFRHPWAWAFVILTKVTPGIGLLWFAARREWRQLAIALGATAVIAGVSYAVQPGLWTAWWQFLGDTAGGATVAQFEIGLPLPVRLLVAAVIVVWGARTDRRWTVPVSAAIALPILWLSGFAICAAIAHEWVRPRLTTTAARTDSAVQQA